MLWSAAPFSNQALLLQHCLQLGFSLIIHWHTGTRGFPPEITEQSMAALTPSNAKITGGIFC